MGFGEKEPFPSVREIVAALVPLVALVSLVVLAVFVFGRDVGDGASQISLLLATALAALLAKTVLGTPWRTIEDSSTVTSVLIPWNTCAMAQSASLGIATLDYLPYCVFNLLSPAMTVTVAAIGKGIRHVSSTWTFDFD